MSNIDITPGTGGVVIVGAKAVGMTRVHLSVLHLLSASLFTRNLLTAEEIYVGQPLGEFWTEIQANATAAVMMAVAALEAYANELFVDHARVFPKVRIELMAKLWELYEQKPPLEKFDFALFLLEAAPLDRGAAPYQDVAALIKLRNGLTHFKPEWSDEQSDHARISNALEHRAARSPFFPGDAPLFPSAWSCYATAKWAVKSVIAFSSEFDRRASLTDRFAPYAHAFNSL
jgi:hypothetical protein